MDERFVPALSSTNIDIIWEVLQKVCPFLEITKSNFLLIESNFIKFGKSVIKVCSLSNNKTVPSLLRAL